MEGGNLEMVKIIAFYLPQYHVIPENENWWGKGFTEWKNVKRAKPLFNGHYQPREPLNDNYYDLLDQRVQEWQAELAKSFGIYGFCYYHYWFKGKLLLEKPAENMLNSGKPDFPFCFAWANEPWTRAWDGHDKEILMHQEYGNEEDWKKHFEYLYNFFIDKRYIKLDEKPVFLIYRTASIPNCEKMLIFWNKLAKENGLKGIYFISMLTSFEIDERNLPIDAYLYFEPMFTISHDLGRVIKLKRKFKSFLRNRLGILNFLSLDILDYNYIWNRIVSRKTDLAKQTYLGAFVDWDNTPRRGAKGLVIKNSHPKKFESYLEIQIRRSLEKSSDFLFINAWNEWAEGAYLEPDKKWGTAYLEAIKNCIKRIEK